jgi:hypothetical protein
MTTSVKTVTKAVTKLLAMSALVALTSAVSNAATITASKSDSLGRTYVDFKGDVNPSDDKTFDSLVGNNPDPNRVIIRLSSPGGHFVTGMNIATTIYEKHLATFVPKGQLCGSICAVMWLAGSTKAVEQGAVIGFHNVYQSGNGQASAPGNAMLGAFLGKLGLSYKAIQWITEKDANHANVLDRETAENFGIEVVTSEYLPHPVQRPRVPQTTSTGPVPVATVNTQNGVQQFPIEKTSLPSSPEAVPTPAQRYMNTKTVLGLWTVVGRPSRISAER